MDSPTATLRDRLLPTLPPTDGWAVTPLVWALALVATAGDLLTTSYGLHVGMREGNSVALAALEAFGLPGLLGLELFALGFAGVCWHVVSGRKSLVPPATLGGVTALVVCLNLVTLFG